MSPRRGLIAFFLIACCIQLQIACAPLPRHVPAINSPPLQSMQIGLCEDYPKDSRTLAHAQQDLEVCHRSGVTALRIAFSWLDMEPRPGVYDFSFWDDFVRLAVDRYHLRLIPYVCYTPAWAASTKGPDYWHSPPRDPADFARFLSVLVNRFKGRIHSWELWNEPDNPAYWTGSAEQYAALVKAGSDAVRRADPSATVVLGGLAGNLSFAAELLKDDDLSPYIDVINLHAYYETWNDDSLAQIQTYVAKAADLIAQYGHHQQIWMAEVGYSSFRPPDSGDISGQYRARFAFEHTPRQQANALLRAATLAASTGRVALFAWYRINDLPPSQDVIGDINTRHLGIIDTHGREKPAFAALREVVQLFAAPFIPLDKQIFITRPIDTPTEVHGFRTSNSAFLLIGWQRASIPGEGPRNAAGNAGPGSSETVTVCLPPVSKHSAAGASAPPPQLCRPASAKCIRMTLWRDRTEVMRVPISARSAD